MFSVNELNNKKDVSYQHFDFHCEELCKKKKEYKRLMAKSERTINKYKYLSDYLGNLYEQWFSFDAITPLEIKKNIQNKISKIRALMHKTIHDNEVITLELDIYTTYRDFHSDELDKHLLHIKTIHHITRKNSKVLPISAIKIKELEQETCCICLDTHKVKDIVTTCCGHTLGKSCFEDIIHKHYYADTEITCPLCRKQSLSFSIYRKTM